MASSVNTGECDPWRYTTEMFLNESIELLTAAQCLWSEDRGRAVASICGVDPLRLCRQANETVAIRHYSHLHGLLPRLGYVVGHEDRVPFDFGEVVALVAPKPALILAPSLDRYARVRDCVSGPKRLGLAFDLEFQAEIQDVLDRLKAERVRRRDQRTAQAAYWRPAESRL
jgi:hypothetical protein